VPRGSVVVTAGGRVLVEGVDYSELSLGECKYQILLKASNTPINVSLENNFFGQQTTLWSKWEHKISDNFLLRYILKMTERPFTQKSSFGQESVNNTIFWIQH
jgi:cell surface protein SprA